MIKLPRLPLGWKEQPQLFERYWDQVTTQIEANINELLALPVIQEALAATSETADTANEAANLAQVSADAAQASADAVSAVAALTVSGVLGATLTATDVGLTVDVSVSSHTRVYGTGGSVAVNSGTISGLSYSTTYYIYYDQSSRAGGSVVYLSTTDKALAVQAGDRHLVGVITTPASAGSPTTGKYVDPSGLGNIVY